MHIAIRSAVTLSLLSAITACSPGGDQIVEDGVFSGELTLANPKAEDGSAYKEYSIELTEGEELNVTMQSNDFDAYIMVHDSDGNSIGEDDDSAGGTNADLTVIAAQAGTYSIYANAFAEDEFGEFILSVKRSIPDNVEGIFSGVLPEIEGKSLASGSYPTHEIAASSGESLDVQLVSGEFDAYVEVRGPDGDVIAEDDDSAGGTNAQVSIPVYDTGIYTVVVKSFEDGEGGPYTVVVRKDAADEGGATALVERFGGELMSWSDRLDNGTPYALHIIDAEAGEELEISMSSNDFDSYLQLWDADETVFAIDDDSGGSLNSRLSFVVPAHGRYVIVANSVGEDATGSYEIMLRRKSIEAEIASGDIEILTGDLTENQEQLADGTSIAAHEIQANAGERLDISMMAGGFDAYLIVFDGQENKLAEDDDSGGGTNARLSMIAPENGTYRVVANSYSSDEGGPYTITVRRY